MPRRLAMCIALLLSLSAGAQFLPAAPGAQVVTLTPQPGFFNEPSIAINPRNPQQLVAAYQIKATVVFSADGGRTWQNAPEVAPPDYRMSGDPSVVYDAQGHAILCYIAFDKLGTQNYWAHNATRNGVFIRRSLDGGAHWEPHAITVHAQPTQPGIPFEDKPYIVGDTTNGPHRGNLYVGWTEFSLTKSIIRFARSTDGGLTWSKPIEISTHEGLPRDDNGSVEGVTGAVAPDGTLYVVWADGNEIAFTYSRDGGRTFARSRSILQTAPPYFQVSDVSRANGFPQINWGPPPGAPSPKGKVRSAKGLLYVTWSDYRNGDVDVFCATSSDGGAHWSPPVRVNSDPVHNGADQFFQWSAVDRADGSAYAIFYDRRGDPANKKTVVVLARSTDGGNTFQNFAWTEQPFVGKNDFLGDYTGLAALNGHVYGVWAEEQPPPPAPPGTAPPTGTPPARPGEQEEPDTTVSGAPKHQTIVRVGVADFNALQPGIAEQRK